MRTYRLLAVLSGIAVAVTACSEHGSNGVEPRMKPRPVTVLPLETRNFSREKRLTGAVRLYREEKVGFEVSGRVLRVLDEGKEVRGPAFDENGREVTPGQVIAKLDDTRYRLQVDATVARLEAAEQALRSVLAELDLAKKVLRRQKEVFARGTGSEQSVDDAQSRYDSLLARKAEGEARINEITEALKRAREDLDDTELVAPFSGRVTRLHVSQGAVVTEGTPVVTLSLMDPIQVHVAVSADDDRRIQTGDPALLYPKDPLRPEGEPTSVNALVYEKGAVADPDTRTFRIDLMARNARRRVDQVDPATRGLPVVTDFLPVARRYQGEAGPLFVPIDAIYREDGRTWVLRLPGVSFHAGSERSAVGRHVPDKVEVVLGDQYMTVIKWNFRALESAGELREGDFLVIGPRAGHLDGLAIGRTQWLLRPGDLVPVSIVVDTTAEGFYVPVDAITAIDGQHRVFVLDEATARDRAVEVHDTFHELRRISGDGIGTGVEVIVGGVHFVSDGQPVTVVGQERVNP